MRLQGSTETVWEDLTIALGQQMSYGGEDRATLGLELCYFRVTRLMNVARVVVATATCQACHRCQTLVVLDGPALCVYCGRGVDRSSAAERPLYLYGDNRGQRHLTIDQLVIGRVYYIEVRPVGQYTIPFLDRSGVAVPPAWTVSPTAEYTRYL